LLDVFVVTLFQMAVETLVLVGFGRPPFSAMNETTLLEKKGPSSRIMRISTPNLSLSRLEQFDWMLSRPVV
jgi:hypothetical protein